MSGLGQVYVGANQGRMGEKKKKKKKLPQSEDGAGAKDKDGKQSRDRKQETHHFPTQWSFLLI